MLSPIDNQVAELSHDINSPLAAIRNALYLISRRTEDAEIHRFLEIADGEVVSIAATLNRARRGVADAQRNARSHSTAA